MNSPTIPISLETLVPFTEQSHSCHDNPAPHCTNPRCPFFYHRDPRNTSWRSDHGSYSTRAFGEVPRYRCRCCKKTFSEQSFKIDYYVKRPVDYIRLIRALVCTSGQGNLSRFTALRYELIQNRYERIARFFLAVHATLRHQLPSQRQQEDFVMDGFESFSFSQYFPNNVNIIVGASSELIYQMGFAQLRRKGQMSDEQRARRGELEAALGKAPPRAIEESVVRILQDICTWVREKGYGPLHLKTDEHPAYVRAFRRVPEAERLVWHQRYSSKAPRTLSNPLFPVNYVDRQFRKDLVNHVRETVQFSRCPAAMMMRLTIYQGYHNYLMPRRVRQQRRGNWQTRAEALGVERKQIWATIRSLWGKRLFYHKTPLWQEEQRTWLMLWRNVGIQLGRRVPEYVRA
jgi:transposase-like protein